MREGPDPASAEDAVRRASLAVLAQALAPERPAGFEDVGFDHVDRCFVFPCPVCQGGRIASPTAFARDGVRWFCARCGRRGTRYTLASMVLGDSRALARLWRFLEDGHG